MKNVNNIHELLKLLGMQDDEDLMLKLYNHIFDCDAKIYKEESDCYQKEPSTKSGKCETADADTVNDTFVISTDIMLLDMIASHVLEHIKMDASKGTTDGSDVVSTIEAFARYMTSFNFVETSFCKITYALNGVLTTNAILNHCYIDREFICSDCAFHTIFNVHVDIVPVLIAWLRLQSIPESSLDKERMHGIIQVMRTKIEEVLMLKCEKMIHPDISTICGNATAHYLTGVLLNLKKLYLGNKLMYKLTLRRKESEEQIQDTNDDENGDIDELLCDFTRSLVGDDTIAKAISNEPIKETSETILPKQRDLTHIPEFIQNGNVRVVFDHTFTIDEYMTDLTIQIPCNKNFSEHPFRIGQLIFSVIDGNDGYLEFARLVISNEEAYADYWKDLVGEQRRPKLYHFEETTIPLFDEHTRVYFGVAPSRTDYPIYRIHIRILGMCAKKYPVSLGVTYIEEK